MTTMKNSYLYVKAPAKNINIQLRECKPLPPMPKAKREDVPEMYRKSIKVVAFNWACGIMFALSMLSFILFFAYKL